MKTFTKTILTASVWLAIALIGAASSWAEDYQPFDWVPLRPHSTACMLYYQFANRNQFNNTITGNITKGTNLDSNLGIIRCVYYEKGWDMNIVVPFGVLNNGRISGVPLSNGSGVGDPIVSAGGWLIENAERKQFLSAASYLTIPIGSYDKHQELNLGNNRWQNDLQANLTQGLLRKYTIDVSGDWVYYGDNKQAGTGNQKLSQSSSYAAYAWFSYETTSLMRNKLPSFVSIGYLGDFGGAQKLDGVSNGAKAGEQQIRGSYTKFITPRWQVLVSASHDVTVSGQFKQDFGLTLRLAKVFGKM